MNKKIIIANWKMNPSSAKEAEILFKKIKTKLKFKKTEIVFCPPLLYFSILKKIAPKIKLGIQNIFYQDYGSYTGEISALMAYNSGLRYVILGHSERRKMGEDNLAINKKVKAALANSLIPIICIGEENRDTEHEYLNIVKNQLEEILLNINKNSLTKIIIAYEPVWAVGKDSIREASSEEFREMKVFIKKILSDKFGIKLVENIKIIYGGSVNFKNAKDFLSLGEADGFLIGRDSLQADKFLKIINEVENGKY